MNKKVLFGLLIIILLSCSFSSACDEDDVTDCTIEDISSLPPATQQSIISIMLSSNKESQGVALDIIRENPSFLDNPEIAREIFSNHLDFVLEFTDQAAEFMGRELGIEEFTLDISDGADLRDFNPPGSFATGISSITNLQNIPNLAGIIVEDNGEIQLVHTKKESGDQLSLGPFTGDLVFNEGDNSFDFTGTFNGIHIEGTGIQIYEDGSIGGHATYFRRIKGEFDFRYEPDTNTLIFAGGEVTSINTPHFLERLISGDDLRLVGEINIARVNIPNIGRFYVGEDNYLEISITEGDNTVSKLKINSVGDSTLVDLNYQPQGEFEGMLGQNFVGVQFGEDGRPILYDVNSVINNEAILMPSRTEISDLLERASKESGVSWFTDDVSPELVRELYDFLRIQLQNNPNFETQLGKINALILDEDHTLSYNDIKGLIINYQENVLGFSDGDGLFGSGTLGRIESLGLFNPPNNNPSVSLEVQDFDYDNLRQSLENLPGGRSYFREQDSGDGVRNIYEFIMSRITIDENDKELQFILESINPEYYDENMMELVKIYQRELGLSGSGVDGHFGSDTLKASSLVVSTQGGRTLYDDREGGQAEVQMVGESALLRYFDVGRDNYQAQPVIMLSDNEAFRLAGYSPSSMNIVSYELNGDGTITEIEEIKEIENLNDMFGDSLRGLILSNGINLNPLLLTDIINQPVSSLIPPDSLGRVIPSTNSFLNHRISSTSEFEGLEFDSSAPPAPEGYEYVGSIMAITSGYAPSLGGINSDGNPDMTAIGRDANVNDGIAVDPDLIPYNSNVYIPGVGFRIADDTGGGMRQSADDGIYHIDIRVSTLSQTNYMTSPGYHNRDPDVPIHIYRPIS